MYLEKEILKESARVLGKESFYFSKGFFQGLHCFPTWVTNVGLTLPCVTSYFFGNGLGAFAGSLLYSELYDRGREEFILIPLLTNLASGAYELYQYSKNEKYPDENNKYELIKHSGGL